MHSTDPENLEFPKDSSGRNQELGQFLHAAKAPSEYGGYFYEIVQDSQQEIHRNLLFQEGQITPAQFLKIAIKANDGNIPLGILAAHNYLKEIAYKGRDHYDRWRKMPKEYGEPVSRLESWRRHDNETPYGEYDKIGPLYHVFAAMTATHWLPSTLGGSIINVANAEAFLRTFRIGADHPDPEKARADECGVEIGQWIREGHIGEEQPTPTPTTPPSEPYGVFLANNYVLVGQKSALEATPSCRLQSWGTDCSKTVGQVASLNLVLGPFDTYENARKAYCDSIVPGSVTRPPLTGGRKAKLKFDGQEHWISNAPGCEK